MSIPKDLEGLATLEAWRDKLAELLEAATRAAKEDRAGTAGAAKVILEVADRLTQFQVWSDPALEGTNDLDEIANTARRDLLDGAVTERVNRLASRSADLEVLEKTLERRAAQDQAKASAMRGDRLLSALDSLNRSITDGVALAGSLLGAADDVLKKDLQSTLATMTKLRDKLQKAGGPG